MKYILMPDPFNLGRRYAYALKAHLLSAVKIHIQPKYHNTISKRCQPFHPKTKGSRFPKGNENEMKPKVTPGFDWSLKQLQAEPKSNSGFRSWLRSWERFEERVCGVLEVPARSVRKDFTRYQPLAKADYLPRGFWGLILIPGPMVVAMETLFMYCPLAAEGFTLISLSINAM